MRNPRQPRLGIALCAAVAVIGISIVVGGARDTRASTGGSAGHVFGTGTVDVGGVEQIVSVTGSSTI